MPVNDTAKNVLGTIGSFYLARPTTSLPPSRVLRLAFDIRHRDYMLDRPGTSSGVQVMARKVNGGPIALAHVSSLLSLARAYQYDLICDDKVHLERVGGVFRCLCDCTRHFHSCKCASATALRAPSLIMFSRFARSSSSLSSFRHSRRYLGCSACITKANDRQSFAQASSLSTSPSLLGGKWALLMQLGWVIFQSLQSSSPKLRHSACTVTAEGT